MDEKKNITANRKYKDTLFCMIFREKENTLSLYNAVNNTNYTNPDEIEIVTLENAIYMNVKNDLAFVIRSEMSLYEHQSTINPNMPLRNLFYTAKEYQKMVSEKSLYAPQLVKIPTPRYVIFYNGTEEQPEKQILRLFDAFEKKVAEPELELVVTMYTINHGNNKELKEKCPVLWEYMEFVNRIRREKVDSKQTLTEVVVKVVDECIHEGILRDFLTKYKAEATDMSIFEYDEEKEMRLYKEAVYQAGMDAGIEQGIQQSRTEMIMRMKQSGLSEEEIAKISELTIEEVRKIISHFSVEKKD